MSKRNYTRREFVRKNSMAGIGAAVALSAAPALLANCAADTGVPAILGGQKIRTKEWPAAPWINCDGLQRKDADCSGR